MLSPPGPSDGEGIPETGRRDVNNARLSAMRRVLTLLASVLILKVTVSVVMGYGDYFPPNFASDFLRGRQSYFFGAYGLAFYVHIASGPLSLILGMILLHDAIRTRYPASHRMLGKIQGVLVLLLVVPSGLWMAYYAETGSVASFGFGILAIVTGFCILMGWRSAIGRRFAEHRRWMWRCFLLLCSAVVIRLIGGLATITEMDGLWIYPLAAWLSWLAPLAAFELSSVIKQRRNRNSHRIERRYGAPASSLSLPAMEISARS